MVRVVMFLLVASIAGLFAVQCSSGDGQTQSTSGTGVTTAAAPTPKQKAPGTSAGDSAQSVLEEAIRKLEEVQSYQIGIKAVLTSTFEGSPREWSYTGSGALARPDKIQWTLEGQADVYMRVVGSGGKVSCTDTRGPNTRDCSLAFGGPRPGSSPFTVIYYLKNFDRATALDQSTIGGTVYDRVVFSPSLEKVSSIDSAHARALSNVTSVQGEAWIDKKTRLPFRERVVVKSTSPRGDETVDMTIEFSKFNEQVNIEPGG